MDRFKLVSQYQPTGDQPKAIAQLVEGLGRGYKEQALLGVTGSGKTFTMANVIAQVNRPTLVLAHNKTLAAQLCSSLRSFFPGKRRGILRQLLRLLPAGSLYRQHRYLYREGLQHQRRNRKAAPLRHLLAVRAQGRDHRASISCIYSLGDPIDYRNMVISLRKGKTYGHHQLIAKLVEIQYERNDINFIRNKFRVRGRRDRYFPRLFRGYGRPRGVFRRRDRPHQRDQHADGGTQKRGQSCGPSTRPLHYIVPQERLQQGLEDIRREMEERVRFFKENDKLIEAQRIEERVNYDIEMLQEIGFCSGIENYSRVLSGRAPGSLPFTLFDYFPEDFLFFVDESHVTLPQARACTRATAPASRALWITASACPRPSTTAR
jgi:excinuclease ABC subunit B